MSENRCPGCGEVGDMDARPLDATDERLEVLSYLCSGSDCRVDRFYGGPAYESDNSGNSE